MGNGLILGYLMYRSELVPQRMAWLGLVGGPLIIASGTAVMFGVDHQQGSLQGITTIPEFLWELFLGLFCTFKGFRPRLRSSTPAVAKIAAAMPAWHRLTAGSRWPA